METVFVCTTFGVFVLLAYTLGLRNGQKIVKQEPIEIPRPIEKIKEVVETKKEQKVVSEYQKLFDNIDNYDKPGYHQKDVKLNE